MGDLLYVRDKTDSGVKKLRLKRITSETTKSWTVRHFTTIEGAKKCMLAWAAGEVPRAL